MLLQQFYLKCLAHASYVVADEMSKQAVVVDPQRDVEQYLALAAEHGLTIGHVVLTHLHADFIAGHLELRDRAGARIYLGAKASAEYAFTPLADGDEINLGTVRLRALSTPGHTPESISLVVFDDTKSREVPAGVLTGDTLFIGDVGRPDLRVALGWSAADLGGMLYDSLHQKLMALPDNSLVYPAHGAGSLCGKAISKETVSTIGEQRKSNYALQPMSKADFVTLVTTDQPDAPAYFTYDAVLNTKERPTLDEALAREVQPIPLDSVLALQESGAQVLDTREAGEFAAAHLAGSINVGLGGQYATWAGTVLNPERSVVIVAGPGTERESAARLGRIGFDQVVGYLQHGLESLAGRPDLSRTTERLGPDVAAARLRDGAVLIDVRGPGERAKSRIAGSLAIPLTQLEKRIGEVPRDCHLIVHCAGGYRSSVAASVLAAHGLDDVSELAGGIAAWEQARMPVEGTRRMKFDVSPGWLVYHPDPSVPRFKVPPGAVDAHCHVFGPGDVFPDAPERKYTPVDASKEQLFALRDRLGFDKNVIVQATCHGTDNRALVDALRASNGRARGVATVDRAVTDAELREMHEAGVRGTRFNFVKRLVDFTPREVLIEIAQRIAPLGWHVVVYFEAADLPELWDFFTALPTTVVVDYMGRPDVMKPLDGPEFELFVRLMREYPNVWSKVSCPERLSVMGPAAVNGERQPYRDVVPFARRLVETFPDRVLWGTDWPHPNLKSHMPDDGLLVDYVPAIAATPELQHKLLVDNPLRLYWK